MVVFLLPFLGQGPALSIWRSEKERGGGKKGGRKEKRGEPRGYGREGGSTCELSLLGQVSRAGAAGDTYQGGCDLGVTAVHVQVAAGQR